MEILTIVDAEGTWVNHKLGPQTVKDGVLVCELYGEDRVKRTMYMTPTGVHIYQIEDCITLCSSEIHHPITIGTLAQLVMGLFNSYQHDLDVRVTCPNSPDMPVCEFTAGKSAMRVVIE